MKNKLLFAFFIILLLCSCSKAGEIEDSAIVIGAAFDKKGEEVVLTVETVDTNNYKEGSAKGNIFSCSASSVYEASRKMTTVTGKPLYWPHLKLMVISDKFAKENLEELLEWVLRSAHCRINTPIAIFKGNCSKFFSLKTSSFISDTLYELIKSCSQKGYTVENPAFEIYNRLQGSSACAIFPLFKTENGAPLIAGSVIYKKGQALKSLSLAETQTVLLLRGILEEGEIILEDISFNITSSKTKTKINISPETATVYKYISLNIALEEANEGFSKEDMEEKINQYIFKNCQDIWEIYLKENKDFLLLNNKVSPKYKKELKIALDISFKSHGQTKFKGGYYG